MFARSIIIASGLVCVVLVSGCATPIHILSPANGPSVDPVPQAVIKFDSKFDPGGFGWDVFLDGVALNHGAFLPTPAPNVTSTVPLPYPLKDFGVQGGYAVWVADHKIETLATCGFFCAWKSESRTFTPPQLLYNGTVKPDLVILTQFATTPVYVGVQDPSLSKDLMVTIKEIHNPQDPNSPLVVQLGTSPASLLPAGNPITVTIPAGSTKADFYIRGESLAYYFLELSGPGATPSYGKGKIPN